MAWLKSLHALNFYLFWYYISALTKNNSEINKRFAFYYRFVQELSFRRLIFITMLAWEKPHRLGNDSYPDGSEEAALQV